jgi:hypothetical protein
MTRLTRILLAAAAGALLLVAFPTTAEAGVLIEITTEYECNEASGDYDVTITITDIVGDGGPINVLAFQVDGADATPPTFEPPSLPVDGSSAALFSVPGDTTTIFLDFSISYPTGEQFGSAEMELEGDCEPVPTTTTTAGETTTTEAAAAEAVRLQPAFTG